MAWQDIKAETERLKFLGDWLKKEFNFTDLCKRYEISRKTGYKLINRFNEERELSRKCWPRTFRIIAFLNRRVILDEDY